jgi:rSAM/selenodomain-associated transferase 2
MARAVTVERERKGSGSEPVRISVIIPTLNEALVIEQSLGRLMSMGGSFEAIVVDNGSTDDTVLLASRWAKTITSAPGRGPAFNAGAAEAKGDILLFLHADTTLPAGAFEAIATALEDPEVVGGCFSVSFDVDAWPSQLVEALYSLFSRMGFFYGDSGIFVRRSALDSIGGFAPLPIMEDFDLCLKLRKRGRTVRLLHKVVTSGRRWRGQGFLKTALVYLAVQGLYLAGVRSPRLFKLYEAVR